MSPRKIVEILRQKGIQLAALTDHNTALNTPAFALLCRRAGIATLYGMEAQTSEEIHVLALFMEEQKALAFSSYWYTLLPPVLNRPEKTGDQVYVDENNQIQGFVEKYLITSASCDLATFDHVVHNAGGLVIPAHVDRPSFSLMSQLGCIPNGNWDALEFVAPRFAEGLLTASYHVITGSDAHIPEHIGRRFFDLDIGNTPLLKGNGEVSLSAVCEGLEKREVCP